MSKIIVSNKKAFFEYEIIEEFIAGIVLVGTEVKSLRKGKTSISEAFCHILNGEVFIKQMFISEYSLIKHTNHNPTRERKLLLNKKEILKLHKGIKEKGFTIVPLSIFLSDEGFFKIKIALVRGKKSYDKRESIRLKDLNRELNRKS